MSRKRPVLIWDGECGFCERWVRSWMEKTGESVEYLASQDIEDRFPQVPRAKLAETVVLVEPDGKVYYGAQAVFRLHGRGALYERIPGLAPVSEFVYGVVAGHRPFFSRVTAWLWGESLEPPSYAWAGRAFAIVVAASYLSGFGSLALQVDGLYGSRGLLPVEPLLALAREKLGASAAWQLPSVFWLIGASDAALAAVCWAGAALALAALLGFAQGPALLGCWALWLSLVSVGRDFLSFQWDVLLLETGFLALFAVPWTLRRSGIDPPRAVVYAVRLLLFRLMISSGAVKLLSGDAAWRGGTALLHHYETQPLPTALAWWAHQLPASVQRFSAGAVFFLELVVPLAIFLPRRPRLAAAALLIGLQLLIAATGNYCYFNLLTIGLCFLLIDDRALKLRGSGACPPRLQKRAALAAALLVAVLGAAQLGRLFGARLPSPLAFLRPLHLVNHYGLFAVMTTERNEILIEGSPEGTVWVEYPFRFKPGALDRAPRWVAPHQPRLDWQMWFAALSDWRANQWFVNLAARVLEGSPPVMKLFASDPLAGAPPKYLRATVYRYRFTRRGDKDWWTREKLGLYCPVISAGPAAGSGSRPRP